MNMQTIRHTGEVLIPDVIRISRRDLLWYCAALCMSIGCAVISGIFFGQREEQRIHAKEREHIVSEFAKITAEKDVQISRLSDVIVKTQQAHLAAMGRLGDSDYHIEKFLVEQSLAAGIKSPYVDELAAHLKEIEATRRASRNQQVSQ